MNAYRIQYWLYAVINRNFGQHVKIERDAQHRRYDVNRHGMHLRSTQFSAQAMEKVLAEVLVAAGYEHTKDGFTKKIGKKRPVIHITQETGHGGARSLYIFLMVY